MTTAPLTVSIVIPTHNRKVSLQRLLDALARQTFPADAMEVVVVADGCIDGTADVVRSYRAPFGLKLVEQPGEGAAAARNHGATLAMGKLLLFLDDDIEPAPGLVAAHVEAHRCQSNRVVIGYLRTRLAVQSGFFASELRQWWEAMFQRMREEGHRYSYRDLLSGNCSLAASLFAQAQGFDPAFRSCYDDYEFGLRLLNSGAEFCYVEAAVGIHHEERSLDGLLQRKLQEGIAEILIGQRQPELIPTLLVTRINQHLRLSLPVLNALVFRWTALGDSGALVLRHILRPLEWVRARKIWRKVLDLLLVYWHWRGVGKTVGTRRALDDFLSQGKSHSESDEDQIVIDLQAGLERGEQVLQAVRPASARITYGQTLLGRICAVPGAERLRAAHLRPRLATDLAKPLIRALLTNQSEHANNEGLNWLRIYQDAPQQGLLNFSKDDDP